MTLEIKQSYKEPARRLYVKNAGRNPKTGKLEDAKGLFRKKFIPSISSL